ncbi:hypothetical protein [Dyadobacter arcticus]|uniref:Oxygen tolerance n=1 Tax=Dyadobacter arcticus TaxID=1078754 RepID=A0ABX0UTH5_9BACT|nr:hypothetical protein [Dyadobacter arcticus]NIJ56067.1 hypothetical protein [Dyadobacter arcticus]
MTTVYGEIKKVAWVIFIVLLFSSITFGQRIKPTGVFLSDSIEVGKPVYFSLSVRHKPETEVFFPDSSFNFSPFEIISQRSFVSSTDERGSLDSAVYQLVSFDVSPLQSLRLPVYSFQKKDCTAVFTSIDSVFLTCSNITKTEEKPVLIAETRLLPLSRQFNFSILIGSIALIIGVAGSIYWVFGQDIFKQWQLIKLQRRHLEYVRSFNRLMRNARERNNIKDAEKAIIVWKNYLERLEKKPFATYTTREIMDNMPDDDLANALQNMDGIVYGQGKSKNMDVYLEVLKTGATRIYRNKRRFILDSPAI